MNKIICPYCGAEYLPQELYIPSDFLPKMEDVVKDDEGKIVAGYSRPLNTHEEYTCDYCGHRFQVEAKVEFSATESVEHDFNFEYKTPLYPEGRIELREND